MATPASSLLADFDFNLTPLSPPAEAPPLVPPRPSTPDPRRTPTPHPPRPVFRSESSLSTGNSRRRLRKKPTAIFVGQQTEHPSPTSWPCPDDVEPLNGDQYQSQQTLPCLLPRFSSTPSPRFATSPSLSSGSSTIQSSPTVTPTTAHFGSFYDDLRPAAKEFSSLDPWDHNEHKYGLRRAKRLPHLDPQGTWQVHAVVHIGEGEEGSGGGSGNGNGSRLEHEQQIDHYNWCLQQQQQAGILESGSAPEPLTIATPQKPRAQGRSPVKRKTLSSGTRPKGFHGTFPESARREGGLRNASEIASSTYTLSKFHFPAPPGDYRIGLSGDLQHPAKIHYRGASFDLVNPHASLLLCASHFETPAEIDGLLDDYFEDPEDMPRLYSTTETARRNIMGLREVEDTAADSHQSSASSLVPPRVPSDPFDLRVTDVPRQAAQLSHNSAGETSTLAGIFDGYDYTRDAPFEHEETLRALESGSSATHSDDVFSQLSDDIRQHMSAELSERALSERALSERALSERALSERALSGRPLSGRALSGRAQSGRAVSGRALPARESSEKASELPTSERTYGDTNQLLNLTPAQRVAKAPSATNTPGDEHEAYMRPAPRLSATEMTATEPGLQSATASVHSMRSQYGLPGSRSIEIPRGGHHMQMDYREISEATIRSDTEGDWETTRSESQVQLLHGHNRPSQDSYANTSTYEESNRMSDITTADHQSSRPYRAAPRINTAADDVERAKVAMSRMYKDKVLEQDTRAKYSGDVLPGGGSPYATDFQVFQEEHARRTSVQTRARNNDIELEEIRRRNPSAVRLAADQLYAENASPPEQPRRVPRAVTPMERLSAVCGVFSPRHRLVLANQRIINDAIAEDMDTSESSRNLLARTPTHDDFDTRLEFSESVNTFRTFRDIGRTPTPSDNHSRSGLDLGERPVTPIFPATVYSPIENRGNLAPFAPEPWAHERVRGQPRHARRAAMSSQTSLRALITSGSPTSNIQGAFTDREMAEASNRWDPFPRRENYNRPYHGRNASARYPEFVSSPAQRSNTQGRMLVASSEALDSEMKVLQNEVSHKYLMRMLACPPLCMAYYWGYCDYLMAKHTDGRIKVMSPSVKDEALSYAAVIFILYALIITGIVTAVILTKPR